jgi:L-threonylcarbamoyladenylate synthase
MLASVIGEVAIASERPADGAARPSPGMLDRHYTPRARLVFAPDAMVLREVIAREAAPARRAAVLSIDDVAGSFTRIGMPGDPAGYARALYATLHRLDDEGYELVIVAPVPADDAWAGIRDRLTRATSS